MSSLLDLLKQKKQDLAAGNRKKTIKPADGTGRYRILPSWRGAGQQFWHDFGQHFIKDSSMKIAAVYMCTEKTFGRPCEVCAAVSEATKAASGDKFTTDLLAEARSAGRILVNALHVDGPTPNEVQILELAPTAFASLVAIAQEWEEAGESILDGARGKDILISRSGTGKQTKYTMQVAAKTAPLPPDALKKLHNLDEYVAQESSEQKLRALNSLRTVAGLLPAPSAAPGTTVAHAGPATLADEDPYAVATPPKRAAAPAPMVEDVTPKAPRMADVPAAPVAAVAPSESTGDDELDALLNGLG